MSELTVLTRPDLLESTHRLINQNLIFNLAKNTVFISFIIQFTAFGCHKISNIFFYFVPQVKANIFFALFIEEMHLYRIKEIT